MTIEDALGSLADQRTLTLTRRAGPTHPSDRLANLVGELATWSPAMRFDRWIDDAGALHPVGAGAAWYESWFAALPDAFLRDHYGGLTLVSRGDDPMTLHYARDLGRSFDRVRISIPSAAASTERLVELVTRSACAWRAHVAWLATDDLVAAIGPTPGRTIDLAAVAEAVGWMNVWAPEVIDAIGRARVAGAPWHAREELGDDGWLLVATAEPPDRAHPEALRHVAGIVAALELAAAQARHPAPQNGDG